MLSHSKCLSPDELLKEKLRPDKAVPQKGGAKDYSPDDSWLQEKRLQVFLEERKSVLSEQRVEKLGNLVQGSWNPDQCLVEFVKEVGKFWSNMGFVDQSRKWLHPEEALFLMESIVLEVSYRDLPLSVEEAYSRMLGKDVSLEEYQAYSHLRRQGYVVLRFDPSSVITNYERQIKIDQHIKKSKRSREKHYSAAAKKQKLEKEEIFMNISVDDGDSAVVTNVNVDESQYKDAPVTMAQGCLPCTNPWGISLTRDITTSVTVRHSNWDFDSLKFPDIGGGKSCVVVDIPHNKYLPQNVLVSEDYEDVCLFNVDEYRQHVSFQGNSKMGDSHVYDLDFSYAAWARNKKKVVAKNWTDYKELLKGSLSDVDSSPVGHLWDGEVTPLIRPMQATTTCDMLKLLQVIENVDLPQPTINRSAVKISFDVHLPNAQFKKTRPGRPNHRVCVVRSCDQPPTLLDISQTVKKLGDDVPVNWAVVNHGDIAFYNMSSFSIPIDISLG